MNQFPTICMIGTAMTLYFLAALLYSGSLFARGRFHGRYASALALIGFVSHTGAAVSYPLIHGSLAALFESLFGTFFFFQAPPGRDHADIIRREMQQVEWSEELGFDEVWFTEHHFIDYGLSVDPGTLAAAAAARTRRVRIGLAAAILPFHDPIRLAEQMALVDILCDGRLDVGVGRGNRPAEFRGYRVPQEQSRERFDEAVEIMLRA
ncbi:MAG: LLM class flavin-dependent oxidoreductase [Chloroflexi bacterium]|nr:LLM class flavin-dependent oxidoreductase [Chloroflexota bacterium]